MKHRRVWQIALAAMLCAPVALAAEAVDLDTVRKTIEEGDAFFAQGNYRQASQRFLDAWSQVKVPTGAWWAGQTQEKLGDWGKAAQFYTVATQLKPNQFWINATNPVQLDAKNNSKARLDAIKQRVPQAIKLELLGDAASVNKVLLDGVEFPKEVLASGLPIAVGAHELSILGSDGTSIAKRTFSISDKQQAVVTLDLSKPPVEEPSPSSSATVPPPASPPSTQPSPGVSQPIDLVTPHKAALDTTKPTQTLRWTAYSSFGVGAAGLLLGATAGIVSLSKHSDLKSKCGDDRGCPSDVDGADIASYDTWRDVTTAAFIVGGVGAALGGTLLWLDLRRERHAAWNLALGPGAIRVDGSF